MPATDPSDIAQRLVLLGARTFEKNLTALGPARHRVDLLRCAVGEIRDLRARVTELEAAPAGRARGRAMNDLDIIQRLCRLISETRGAGRRAKQDDDASRRPKMP